MIKIYKNKEAKRKIRVRSKIKRTRERPRLTVFRSNKHIYCQIIDDVKQKTLVSSSDKELKERVKGKTKIAFAVGLIIAKKALEKGIKAVIFDRGGYKYHGRVKALAEGAREGGLKF